MSPDTQSGGRAAAVLVTVRTDGKTSADSLAWASSRAKIVGTPGKTVTSSSATRLITFAGKENERSRTTDAPSSAAISSW